MARLEINYIFHQTGGEKYYFTDTRECGKNSSPELNFATFEVKPRECVELLFFNSYAVFFFISSNDISKWLPFVKKKLRIMLNDFFSAHTNNKNNNSAQSPRFLRSFRRSCQFLHTRQFIALIP